MQIREKLKRRVIELIHGFPYDEAVEKEFYRGCIVNYIDDSEFIARWTLLTNPNWDISNEIVQISTNDGCKENIHYVPKDCLEIIGLPITIGRVMKVLSGTTGEGGNFYKYIYSSNDSEIQMLYYENGQITLNTIICFWKLTKENGQECIDDDQKDETIEKIYNLIK